MKIVADANIPFVRECFSSIGEVEVMPGREITSETIADADALLVRSITPVNAALLAGSRVRFVATATIGFDHIDADYLRRHNIGFASAPGSNANSAAEYVIAALLEIAQKHHIDLEGKSIGIIGVGNVGSRVAAKCVALGMETLLNDPPLQRQTGNRKYLPIKKLLGCDFLTLHTPLTHDGPDRTYHLADEKFFASLRGTPVFMNASRGAVVDSAALSAAINAGRLRATVLDVWENEPNIDTNLLKIVDIGTPHIAGYSLDGKIAGLIMIYQAACEHFGPARSHSVEDFLPEPDVSRIAVDPNPTKHLETLVAAVESVYDIKRDDACLRGIQNTKSGQAGIFFDNLRKEYPVRREFHNTKAVLSEPCEALANKLAGIGFKI
ncbi:MAG: 4-phosphoerythronate dehydrogenase PdxB [Sedimentisphaerales bacterium]|nr:4-phosphoerythronate dehydrogenase PdxB [Sedimentisphaerales bacterium]